MIKLLTNFQQKIGVWKLPVISVLFLLFFLSTNTHAQRTQGLFQNDQAAYNGYTLFAPTNYTETYLIDNCGKVVQQWSSDYPPGLSVYLLENGNLLRTAAVLNPRFSSGGGGGRIELFSWDGDLIWSYNYSDTRVNQHHDIEYLPNGNILILAWERFSRDEIRAMGRDVETSMSGLWATQIIEIEPSGTEAAEIVWEWSALDHIVQNRDSSLSTFGQPSDYPERIDLNYAEERGGGGFMDWIHVNSIDYNPELDQILLSARKFQEVWVIDHSTTTEEAASNSGGRYAKGGDLLYRFGNPAVYGQGTEADRQLYWQHDATWLSGLGGQSSEIMLFNNGTDRAEGNWSSVDRWLLPQNEDGTYRRSDSLAFKAPKQTWQYPETPNFEFYSRILSGAQLLPNGNVLMCEGTSGEIIEVTPEKQQVWHYRNPVNASGPLSQTSNAINNLLFRAERYSPNYPAFIDRDLTPRQPIEIGFLEYDCHIFEEIETAVEVPEIAVVKVFPNPTKGDLHLSWEAPKARQIQVVDMSGKVVLEQFVQGVEISLFLEQKGFYFLRILDKSSTQSERILVL